MYRITATKADGTTRIETASADDVRTALVMVMDRGYVKAECGRHTMTRNEGS